MTVGLGDTVYQYTFKHGCFYMHEGVVVEDRFGLGVYFEDKKATKRHPDRFPKEFGVSQSGGTCLWLTERNDEYARRVFIECREQHIADLYKQIDTTTKMIKLLKGEEP